MSFAKRLFTAIVATFVVSTPLLAVTYVVPEDRVLIRSARAIVVGTVLESRVLMNGSGGIETVTSIKLEDVIKGGIQSGIIDVFEPGGAYGGTSVVIPGVPRFQDGERVLLLLNARSDGRWVVAELGLGKFTLMRDEVGQSLLVRHESEITGWDSQLNLYRERRRGADTFLAFVRAEVESPGSGADDYFVDSHPLLQHTLDVLTKTLHVRPLIAPYTAGSYTLLIGANPNRWPQFPVTYRKGPTTEPGASGGGDTAANSAMSAWNSASGANISISYSAVAGNDAGTDAPDGRNTIMYEQNLSAFGISPFTCSGSTYNGTLGIGFFFGNGTHQHPDGETFGTIVDGDVQMNQGLANCTVLFNAGDFDSAVAHEVGHTLGFRHADQGGTFSSPCTATMECSNYALMTAFVTKGLHARPTTWDSHAAAAVYPGASTCTAPSITTQPQPSTITAGNSATLTVVASGTMPLTYQWYQGPSGTITTPVGSNSATFQTGALTSTTTYWVRVTGQCGTPVDSNGATVTVNPATCTPPSITSQPSGATISSGGSAVLSVGASGTTPLTYQWYQGPSGTTNTPVGINSATFQTGALTSTAMYWVRVTGQCGTPADSIAATVTVNASTCPAVTVGTPTAIAVSGGFQLSVSASTGSGGGSLTYTWYSNSIPVGFGNPLAVNPSSATTYSVMVTNGCGNSATSPIITVTPSPTCTAPSISSVTATPASIPSGAASTLTVTATGSSLNYQWYAGTPGDTSQPVIGGNAATISVTPLQTTSYWVLVSSGCGATPATSSGVTVTVTVTCTPPTITTPASQLIPPGWSATLTASAEGTAPLHYQWYQGATGTTTTPVGSDSATYSTAMLTSTTQYWVQVTNGCGSSASSGTITITVQPARRRPARR